ncbi:hypothetical protein BCR42DRAFT_424317 [Absidia repens]|uniref:Uncharacterized protein n=1 Tax=Absidia repens TaxID=90262 RepID=A0A1X2I4C7_9FUNG|nr:hypothetical protein BCR42DRAFT_424317 [Absidia repens]
MTRSVLPLELLYHIVDQVLESELQHYELVSAPSTLSTTYQLVVTHRAFQAYLQQQDRFHRLRLWRLLNRISRQFEPVQVAVGTMDSFTVLSLDMSAEKITNLPHTATAQPGSPSTETFLVLRESSASIRSYRAYDDHLIYVHTTNRRRGRDGKTATQTASIAMSVRDESSKRHRKGKSKYRNHDPNDALYHSSLRVNDTDDENDIGGANNNNDDDDSSLPSSGTLALFPLSSFVSHIQLYALHHDASVWLWKKSARFFRGPNLDLLLQQQFRYILDTPRHALIAWDRPSQGNFRFTDNVLNSNVELFSKLLTSF